MCGYDGGGLLGLSCCSFSRLICGIGSIAQPSPTLKSDGFDVENRAFRKPIVTVPKSQPLCEPRLSLFVYTVLVWISIAAEQAP